MQEFFLRATLPYHRLNCSKSTGKYLRCYQVGGDFCMHCPKRPSCFDKAGIRRRVLASSCYPAFFRGHQRVGTPEYLAMMRLRKIWAEGSFSVLKREHCISRIRKRGILAATEECLLAAMALNLKRMVNAIFRYFQIYCSAGTTVGFSRIFAFVNRSLIGPYLSARSCSRVLGFSILFDLPFLKIGIKRPSTFRTLRPVNGQFFDIRFLCLVRQIRVC